MRPPRVLGPFGAHVRLWTSPRTPYFPTRRRYGRDRAFDIRGRTEPALRGQVIALRYTYLPRRGASRQRTYPDWDPRAPGAYRIYAVYKPRPGANRFTDQSCSRRRVVPG